MAIDNNAFYKYQEKRATSGYKNALLVKEIGKTYYTLLIASETVPSIFGTQDTFEFDLLNSPSKGKIGGKMSLDDKEVEFLYHRDNAHRLQKFVNAGTLDFVTLTPEFVAYKFTGTMKFRPNDASADVFKGTYTITPMSASDKPILNARDVLSIREALCFKNAIPEYVDVTTTAFDLDLSVEQLSTGLTYKMFTISGENNTEGTASAITVTNGTFTVPTTTVTGLYGITVSETADTTYAPWTTTVYIKGTAPVQ